MKSTELAEISSSKLLIIAVLLVIVLIVTITLVPSLMPTDVEPIQTSEVRIDIITELSNTTHLEVYLDNDAPMFASVTIEPGGWWSGQANLTRGPHHINLYFPNSTSILGGNTSLGETYWLQHEFWVYPPYALVQTYILTSNGGLRILETREDWHPY